MILRLNPLIKYTKNRKIPNLRIYFRLTMLEINHNNFTINGWNKNLSYNCKYIITLKKELDTLNLRLGMINRMNNQSGKYHMMKNDKR